MLGVSSLAHLPNCGKAVGASGLFKALTHKRISLKERVDHVPFLAGLFTSQNGSLCWIFADVNPDRGVQSRPERDEESVGRRVDRYRSVAGNGVPLAMDFPE